MKYTKLFTAEAPKSHPTRRERLQFFAQKILGVIWAPPRVRRNFTAWVWCRYEHTCLCQDLGKNKKKYFFVGLLERVRLSQFTYRVRCWTLRARYQGRDSSIIFWRHSKFPRAVFTTRDKIHFLREKTKSATRWTIPIYLMIILRRYSKDKNANDERVEWNHDDFAGSRTPSPSLPFGTDSGKKKCCFYRSACMRHASAACSPTDGTALLFMRSTSKFCWRYSLEELRVQPRKPSFVSRKLKDVCYDIRVAWVGIFWHFFIYFSWLNDRTFCSWTPALGDKISWTYI